MPPERKRARDFVCVVPRVDLLLSAQAVTKRDICKIQQSRMSLSKESSTAAVGPDGLRHWLRNTRALIGESLGGEQYRGEGEERFPKVQPVDCMMAGQEIGKGHGLQSIAEATTGKMNGL